MTSRTAPPWETVWFNSSGMIVSAAHPRTGPATDASPPRTTIKRIVMEIPTSNVSVEIGPWSIWYREPHTPQSAAYIANDTSLNLDVVIPSDAATGSLRRPIMSARPIGLRKRFLCPTKNTSATPPARYQNCRLDRWSATEGTPALPPVNDAKCNVRSLATFAY